MFRLDSHLQADFEMTKFTWVILLHFRMTHFVFEHKKTPLEQVILKGCCRSHIDTILYQPLFPLND